MKTPRKLPNYGNLYSLDEFIEQAKSGLLTDYDGIGYYTDEKYMYEPAYPSNMISNHINTKYSKVIWFNR